MSNDQNNFWLVTGITVVLILLTAFLVFRDRNENFDEVSPTPSPSIEESIDQSSPMGK